MDNNSNPPIVDQAAYDEYQKYCKHPILNDKSRYTASDGVTYNLGMTAPNLQKNIVHLPEDEQHKIMKIKTIHYQIMGKRNAAMRKAYKVIVNSAGERVINQLDKLEDKKPELIDLFGKMFTIKEVHQICIEQFHIKNVSLKQVEMFRAKYNPEIGIKIEEHKRSFSDIRLGYKRSRLEELSWMYTKRKRIYQMTGKSDDHRLLLQTIEQIRKEAEGDMLKIDANLNVAVEGAINDHVQKDLLKSINIKEIILARVAAKAGLQAAKLIATMSRSYYHGALEAAEQIKVTEYPSLQTYDFDKISRQYTQQENNAVIEQKAVEILPEKVAVALSIKDILKAKLQAAQGDINYSKNTMQSMLIDKTNTHGN